MAVSLHELSIVQFTKGLKMLSTILKKGEDYADEKSIPHSELLDARLVSDMKSLPFQIWLASDVAKGAAVRVAGTEPVEMSNDQNTFPELQDRIARTIDVLNSVSEESMEGKEGKEVELKTPFFHWKFTAKDFLLDFAIPDFWFHVMVAYSLLRMKGVPVGKMDFLAGGNPGIGKM